MWLIRCFLCTITVSFTAGIGAAQGRLLETACNRSDAVVLGVIEPVLLTPPFATFTIAVDRVLKGDVGLNTSLNVTWPGSLTGARMRPQHYRALWFLQKTSAGGWEISPISGRKAPIYASGLAVPAEWQSTTQLPAQNCYAAAWTVLKLNAAHIDESPVYLTAMETLLQDNATSMAALLPDFAATLRLFSQSPSSNLRTLALASGIRAQEPWALAQLASEPAVAVNSRVGHQVALALAAWRGAEPEALAALAKIAQAPASRFLARPAAQALMMIHTREAIPHLIALLASSDPPVQDAAIRGLSLFVRGAPILSAENVRVMAHLTEDQNPDFLDDAIAPYVSITPVPPGRDSEYVRAWMGWWERMQVKWPQ